MVAAGLLRLAWLGYVFPDPSDGRFDDTVFYRGAAIGIARGEGYLNAYKGTPTAAWPPGYPAFLGGVFKAFGEGATQTYWANIILMLLTIVFVYAISATLFGRRTAVVAAALLSVWPGQVFFTSLTLSEPLFTCLLTLSVLLSLLVPAARHRGVLLVGLGLVTAATILTRGQAAILLPLIVVTWILAGKDWRSAIRWGAMTILVCVAAMTPWTIRNQIVMGSPVLVSTNVGRNLWVGHHEAASGQMDLLHGEQFPEPGRSGLSEPEFEVAASNLALRKGLRYAFTHPRQELRLSGVKIRALYDSDAAALDWNAAYQAKRYFPARAEVIFRRLANGFWFAAVGLAAVAMIHPRTRPRREALLLPLLVALWTAVHVLFFAEPRFHYPIVFAIAILAARTLLASYDWIAAGKARRRPAIDTFA